MRKNGWRVAITAGLVLAFAGLVYAGTTTSPVTPVAKSFGGSTGDSCIAAADSSAVVVLPDKLKSLRVIVATDSSAIYKVLISPDGGAHYFTADADTNLAGAMETTADFGEVYAGMAMRIVLDNIPAAGAAFGRAYYRTTYEK